MPSLTNWQLETGVSQKSLSLPSNVLHTKDIEGAQCKPPRQQVMKPTTPIAGTSVRRLIPQEVARRNDYNLNTSDIYHSTPQVVSFATGRECNPLVPSYKLPSYTMRPTTPPQKGNDTCNVKDIPGTAPSPLFRWQQRDTMNINDIEKTSSISTIGRRSPGYGLKTSDICTAHGKRGLITNRQTNPLTPKYKVANAPPGGPQYFGMDGLNHPKPQPKAKPPDMADFSLKSKDVPGCQSKPPIPFPQDRRQWGKTCNLEDMMFAVPTTKHSAMRPTTRVTNPNNALYTPLDHKKKTVSLPRV